MKYYFVNFNIQSITFIRMDNFSSFLLKCSERISSNHQRILPLTRNHSNTCYYFPILFFRLDRKSYNFLFCRWHHLQEKYVICFWTFLSILQYFIYLHDWRVWLRIFLLKYNIWRISLMKYPICQIFMLWHNTSIAI